MANILMQSMGLEKEDRRIMVLILLENRVIWVDFLRN
jgi:hypothetical protein